MVNDLLEAWVDANILLENFNKFCEFLVKYCYEGSIIPGLSALKKQYLIKVFYKYIEKLQDEFVGLSVAIIIDKTTNSYAHSIINVLFSYKGKLKLVSVEFLQEVNNTSIDQLVL
ncbi:276_t:CDS:1 [Cetraspora pellucida]|uniref:276_t:CDS:1 n=1 Tax=Cetraspora pellucida TaxID=1433469 RepID=A0A9N9J6J7_9GLOM|nr:276_t:CDS:1 [Cetraspora pellucida]